jgi:ParB family chromosome partitioning protein
MPRTKLPFTLSAVGAAPLNLSAGPVSIAVTTILPRREDNARPLSATHVVTLAESILALGVLEPPVIDTEGHLLAGAHRLAALLLLAENDLDARRTAFLKALGKGDDVKITPEVERLAQRIATLDPFPFAERYPRAKVPVLVIDTSGAVSQNLDLAIETAENGVRKQYTRDEIVGLAKRLKEAGYTDRNGRPKEGEKSIKIALEAILGCSTSTVKRMLKGSKKRGPSWEKAAKALQRAARRLLDLKPEKPSKIERELLALATPIAEFESE